LNEADAKRVVTLEKEFETLTAAGKFAEAQTQAEEVLRLRTAAQGKDHWETVNAHWTVVALQAAQKQSAADQAAFAQWGAWLREAEALAKKAQHAQAQPLREKVLAICRQVLGEQHPHTAESYERLAINLVSQGKYTQAQPLAEKALAICRSVLGEQHPQTAKSYNSVAVSLYFQERFAEAQPLLEKALALRRQILGEQHPDTAQSYNNVANNLGEQGKYAQAQPLLEKALALRRQAHGEEHEDTATSYNNVAYNLYQQANYAEAQPLYEKALAIRRRVLGENDPQTASSYNNLALNLDAQSKYAEAQPLFEKALALRRQVLGEKHPHTATSYNNLAIHLDELGKYAQAQELGERALAIRREVLGEDHPQTAASYNNVASNLTYQARYAEAQPLFEHALTIHRQVLGDEHPRTATCYSSVANNLDNLGRHAEAQPLHEKALAIRRRVLGERHPQTAASYGNVASNLLHEGRAAEAQRLFEQALAIQREVLGEEATATATGYGNVAANLHAQGRYVEAQPLYEKALAIRRRVLGEEHPETLETCDQMALNLYRQGKYAQAQALFEQILAIRRRVLGEEALHTALSYHNLALNLNAQGLYAEAQPLYDKALAVVRRVRGEEHRHTARCCTNVALNLLALKKPREAIVLLQAACRAGDYSRTHGAGSGFDRALFEPSDKVAPHQLLAIARAALQEAQPAWEEVEAYLARGLLDDLDPASRRDLASSSRLEQMDQQLVPLLSRSDLTSAERGRRDALLQECATLRQTLTQAAAERSARRVWPLEKLQAALPDDTAVLVWLDVRREHWAGILRRTGPPRWQQLTGTALNRGWKDEDIQLAGRTYETALVRPDHPERDQLLAALRAQRLDPLLPHLEGVKHLLIVPTNYMARVPVEALTDRFTISYIPSASVYAQLQQQHRPLEGRSLLALGNPEFRPLLRQGSTPPDHGVLLSAVVPQGNADKHGLKAGDVLLRYNEQPLKSSADLAVMVAGPPVPVRYWREGVEAAVRLDAGRLGAVLDPRPIAEAHAAWQASTYTLVAQRFEPYTPLPGTKVEVEALARLVPQTKLLLGSDASEQTLAELVQSGELRRYRLLHLATHGQVNEGVPTESALILAQDRVSLKLADQLARTLRHERPKEGKLTVSTILDDWQLDADQVVLSACETGLGPNASGEGLLGFAHALLQKGARSVVLSRWKVPDAATALLMQRYYANILGKREGLKEPMTRAAGLREAKTWLRNLTQAEVEQQVAALSAKGQELRSVKPEVPVAGEKPTAREHPFAAPFYWAAFVLIGDPE
jgi:CHAT domain-containing protein/tetratricopeptide (TPR) repeat protein